MDLDTIELLVNIAIPSRCSDEINQYLSTQKFAKHDLQTLQPLVFDTIAALLGNYHHYHHYIDLAIMSIDINVLMSKISTLILCS